MEGTMNRQVEKIRDLLSSLDFGENRLALELMRQFSFSQCEEILEKTHLPTFIDYNLRTEQSKDLILLSLFRPEHHLRTAGEVLHRMSGTQLGNEKWRSKVEPSLKAESFRLRVPGSMIFCSDKVISWMEEVLCFEWCHGEISYKNEG